MRILACAYACAPPGSEAFSGGEELLGWRLVQHIGRRHEVDVLTSERYESSIRADASRSANFIFLGLPSFLAPLLRFQGGIQLYAYLWQCRAAFAARRLQRERGYDLFHHITYANDWMASHTGAVLDIPYIRGPGGGAHRVPRELLPDYSLRFRFAQWLRGLGQRMLRKDPFYGWSQDRAHHLFVCTSESRSILPYRWKEKSSLLPVVGLEREDFPERSSDPVRTDDGLLVVTAGKLLPHKGFDLAIEAFAKLAQQDSRPRLAVVGEGAEGDRLRSIAQERSVEDRVDFTGWKDRGDLLHLFREASIFLFPSLRDGGGAVVVEAMASGTPVVCLDVGGPGLHVTEKCGVKVEPADRSTVIRRLGDALLTLARSEQRRRRLGRAARDRAERYLWSRHAERIFEEYRRAVGGTS